MKQWVTAMVVAASVILVGIPASPAENPEFAERTAELLSKAPWMKHRVEIYHYRLAVENPPENIRHDLFDLCLGSSIQQRSSTFHTLSSAAPEFRPGMLLGEYDPFVKVQNSDSLGSSPNFAINTVSNRLLVVWQDERSGFDNSDIYAQVFDLTYKAMGSNVKVNPAGIKAAQIAPDVCALADGRFLVCWEDYSTTTPQIMAQRINQDGSLQGSAVKVSPFAATAQLFPKVVSYGDSTHVTWLQKDNQDYNIYIRTLNLAAIPQAPAVRVNDDANGLQWVPEIAHYGNGQTMVVWEDKRTGNSEIYAQIYKADGVKRGDNFVVNADASNSLQWRPAVAGNETTAQIVWEDYQNRAAGIYSQKFDRYGLPLGENQRLDQPDLFAVKEKPSIYVDEQGQRVFAWQENSSDAWRLKFALCPAGSDMPIYYLLGEADALHEFTDITLSQVKNTIYFAFLGQPLGGKSTVLSHKVTFTTVPVELMRFQASAQQASVRLTWQTASESSNLGFAVERMREGESFQQTAFIYGAGTTVAAHEYAYEDRGLIPGRYHYRLRQVNLDGTSTTSEEITVLIASPDEFELLAAYPNPFQNRTQLTLRLPVTSDVVILVYNLRGQQVRRITSGSLASGQHLLHWDGCNDAGSPLPTGEYIIRVGMESRSEIMRVSLVR